jgi:hypothetical protein
MNIKIKNPVRDVHSVNAEHKISVSIQVEQSFFSKWQLLGK